jgi:isopenicillin-N epimerase
LDVLTKRFGTQPIAQDDDWAQMVAIPVAPQDPDSLRKRLFEECRIEVPITTHGDQVFVRVSFQGYNTIDDIERLLAADALN